jgi:ferric-chelate reductase
MSLPTISRDLAAADSGSPQSSPAAPPVNNLRLVFDGDIILLALFACFVVVSLPRAFARLSSAWSQGHILRSLSDNRINRKGPVSTKNSSAEPEHHIEMKSDNSHTAYSHTDLAQRENGNAAFPYHVPTLSTLLHPIASPLKRRTMPGFSLGQTLILVIYSTILIYLSLYKSSTITDPERTGVVAMSQIPFVFAFAMKNNLLGAFVGLGYEKVRFLFKMLGSVFIYF